MGTSLAVALGGQFSTVAQPGAGRARDYSFPEPSFFTGGSLSQTQAGTRQGSNAATGFPLFARTIYTGDPGNPQGPAVVNGVNVYTMLSAAAAGQGFACICLQPRLNPSFITTDDYAFTRIIWTGAALGNPLTGGATTDVGLYVVQANSATPDMRMMGGIAGFGFQFPTQSTIQFVAQGPNGRVLTPIPQIADTNLHNYELQIIPATRSAYAQLLAFIDGVPFALPALSSSWAPGTNLPPLAINSGKLGFAPGLMNNSLSVCNLLWNNLKVIQAPTLQDCF